MSRLATILVRWTADNTGWPGSHTKVAVTASASTPNKFSCLDSAGYTETKGAVEALGS